MKVFLLKRTGLSNPSSQRFADQGRTAEEGNLRDFIRNNEDADRQFKYFVPNTSARLMQAGLSGLNQSIKVVVY